MSQYQYITIEIALPLTEEELRRVDAVARWRNTTREELLETMMVEGCSTRLESGLHDWERIMAKYPSLTAALADMRG